MTQGRPASLKQIDDRFELDPKEVTQTIAKLVGKKAPLCRCSEFRIPFTNFQV